MSSWFTEYGWGEVAPGLCTGAHPQDAGDVAALLAGGVTSVVNLCADAEYGPGARAEVEAAWASAGVVERRIVSVDLGGLPPALLEEGARAVAAGLDAGERVYLHCRAGWQRSATVAAAVLVVRDGAEPAAALREIRARRPVARPLEHQVADLVHWARTR